VTRTAAAAFGETGSKVAVYLCICEIVLIDGRFHKNVFFQPGAVRTADKASLISFLKVLFCLYARAQIDRFVRIRQTG